ncbi:unnamed protein product [Owenia fusiformis]|uniref:5'-nucleotidase n=1 Tax=Owenia fusiformis TaxID=6347 RepID=A0A8J1XJ37_OWEFU|nr:unnamed protein product [Owenia fusiformis]
MHAYIMYLPLVIALTLCAVSLGFNVTVIHTNDCHARIEESDRLGGPCPQKEKDANKCFGGVARRFTAVKDIRENHENVIFLDAGDQFQGTIWFYAFEGRATSQFMNEMGYDAMALGNHEFDNHLEGLIPFINNVTFPILAANIDASDEPTFQGLVKKYTVLTVAGEKIGVVGYLTSQMPALSQRFGKLKFLDEIETIQAEVDKLTAQGINKIIALGHSGYKTDKEIAKQVTGVDLVIGGHTNNFLFNGPLLTDGPEVIEDPYPVVITQASGKEVLVVQDYFYGKYLGYLNLEFNDEGIVTSYNGNPILLNGSIAKDPGVQGEMEGFMQILDSIKTNKLAYSNVFLNGEKPLCRIRECNLGNLFADSLVDYFIAERKPTDLNWNGNNVSLAFHNSGGLRSSINAGDVTMENVLAVMPFQNLIDMVALKGNILRQAFEHSVGRYPEFAAEFLQVSGFHVVYDVSKPPGSRVETLEVLCTECREPMLEPVDDNKIYNVIMPAYVANGGDGYFVIRDNKLDHRNLGILDSDVFITYIKKLSPLYPNSHKRIVARVTIIDMLLARVTIIDMLQARITIIDMLRVRVTIIDMLQTRVTIIDMLQARVNIIDMLQVRVVTIIDMLQARVTIIDMLQARVTIIDMLQVRVITIIDMLQVRVVTIIDM